MKEFHFHNSRIWKTRTRTLIILSLVIFVVITTSPQVQCGQKFRGKSGWFRRFALPKDTTLNIQPTLSLPYLADDDTTPITAAAEISFPTKIYFDRLGWTNLFNVMTNSSSSNNANMSNMPSMSFTRPIFHLMNRRRYKRSVNSNSNLNSNPNIYPKTKSKPKWNPASYLWDGYGYSKRTTVYQSQFGVDPDIDADIDIDHPGGERATLLPTIVKTLDAMGVNGRPCLQRAICEIHEDTLKGYGLLGEILILVFSVSKSRFAKTKHLQDLLEAERLGKRNNCYIYSTKCKTSIFKWHRTSF